MRIQIAIFYFLIFLSIQQEINQTQPQLGHSDKFLRTLQESNSQKLKFLSKSQAIQQDSSQGDKLSDNPTKREEENQVKSQSFAEEQGDEPAVQKDSSTEKIEKEIEWSLLFLMGLFCTALGILFEWKNEKYLIRFLKLLDSIRSKCKTQEFAEGDLIFISGKVNYNYNLADPLFNLNIEKAVKIFRKIEMVQYEEKNKKEEEVDENGNLKLQRMKSSQRGTKSSDYVKKWISYRVPILNFKNQDKIQKSQKYCKFIAETDSFQMSKISLSIPNASPLLNQVNSPLMTPHQLHNNQNFSNVSAHSQSEVQGHKLTPSRSLKALLANTAVQSGSMTTPNLQYGMNHSTSLMTNQHGGLKVYITDFTCFDEFPKQQFNYNMLTNNEKELIINKVEDLRRLQVTFQDWQFDTHVLFKDEEVIISRKQDFKMHLGDNKMQHYFIYADEISILGKLGSKGQLIPYYSIEESNEDIELDEMDDVNNSPLLRKRNKEIPFLSLKSQIYSTESHLVTQQSGVGSITYNNDRMRNNNNESTLTYYLCYIPRLMKNIFAFDDKVYWALDKVVNLDDFLAVKKEQFCKLVKICRYISLGLVFLSMYLCIFPILNVFGLLDVDNIDENKPFFIKMFIAILSTFAIILSTMLPLYTVYKIQYAFVILPSIILLLYIIHELSL